MQASRFIRRLFLASLLVTMFGGADLARSSAQEGVAAGHIKLFAVGIPDSLPAGTPGSVYRFDVEESGGAELEMTLSHSSFDAPFALAFDSKGELFVTNRGWQAGNSSVSRFTKAKNKPKYNGSITNVAFSHPHGLAFRGDELLLLNSYAGDNRRYVFDQHGAAVPNGAFADFAGWARGIAISPWGEIFISQSYSGGNVIVRYLVDATGAVVPNGIFGGNGLSNPHGLAFSPWGELFVANADASTVSRFVFDEDGDVAGNGVVTTATLNVGVAFSPWGELFVSSYVPTNLAGNGVISRFEFDLDLEAVPHGNIVTPKPLGYILFGP